MNIRYQKISKFSAQFIFEVKLVEIHIENGKKIKIENEMKYFSFRSVRKNRKTHIKL